MVILGYCLDDDSSNGATHVHMQLLQERDSSSIIDISLINQNFAWSALYRLVYFHLIRNKQNPEMEQQRKLEFKSIALNTVDKYMQQLSQLAEEHNFAPLVVIFPYLDDLTNYKYQHVHEVVSNITQKHSIPTIDLLETMRKCQGDNKLDLKLNNQDIVHPNSVGHNCAARVIADYILELKAN